VVIHSSPTYDVIESHKSRRAGWLVLKQVPIPSPGPVPGKWAVPGSLTDQWHEVLPGSEPCLVCEQSCCFATLHWTMVCQPPPAIATINGPSVRLSV